MRTYAHKNCNGGIGMGTGRAWSAEETDLLLAMWRESYSEGEIARTLNRTRCSIGGKLQRERTKGHIGFAHIEKKLPLKWGRTASGKRRKKSYQRKPKPMAPPPPDGTTTIVHSRQPRLHSQPCSLLELDSTRCRFPIGDPREADFHFCGGLTLEASVYCPYHMRLSYNARPIHAPQPATDTRQVSQERTGQR
jgi:GcrA cell cycle regulator